MPPLAGAWFFACPLGMSAARVKPLTMNRLSALLRFVSVGRLLSFIVCLFPSWLVAHPGHYHPDEVDEFDFFRATIFHSHGAVDLVIAAVALGSVAMLCLHGKRPVRIAAALVALVTIPLLALS